MKTPQRNLGLRMFWDAYMGAAILLWAIFLCGICVMVYRSPSSHSVMGVYHWALLTWFAQQPLQSAGWHYFPQFVFFFMPFYALPQPWCDIAWRVFSTAVFVSGLWASQLLRILAAVVTAWLSVAGAKRAKSDAEKAAYFLGLSTIFLVLFNPMTEKNSYVIVIPVLAFVAILFLLSPRRHSLGCVMALVGGSTGAIPEIFRKQVPGLGLWWGPLVILAFTVVFVFECFRGGLAAFAAALATPPELTPASTGETKCC